MRPRPRAGPDSGASDGPELDVDLSELLFDPKRDRRVPRHPADRLADDDVEASGSGPLEEV
jgi:hypothetical protein